MASPDVVDRDAGRQRVLAIDDPAGQREPAAGADLRIRGVAWHLPIGRLGPGEFECSRSVGRIQRLLVRGLSLIELFLRDGQTAAGLHQRRGGLGLGGLGCSLVPTCPGEKEGVERAPGSAGVAPGLEDIVVGNGDPQRSLRRGGRACGFSPRLRPAGLGPLVFELLGGQDRQQCRAFGLGQYQGGLGDVPVLDGVAGRPTGASQPLDRTDGCHARRGESVGLAGGGRKARRGFGVVVSGSGQGPVRLLATAMCRVGDLHGPRDAPIGFGPFLVDDKRPLVRTGGRERQRDRLDGDFAAQHDGSCGPERAGLVRPRLIAAKEQIGRSIQEVIEDARQAGLGPIGLAGDPVEPDLVGLEERAEPVIVGLGDRVVLVIVAPGALDGQAQECAGRVLDGIRQPGVAVEDVPVAGQEAGGADRVGIVRRKFVAREHLQDHPVVALVGVERRDDPVAPVPEMRMAVPGLLAQSVPVAIPPDVHPVPCPALAVSRAGQEPVDDPFLGAGVSSRRKA